MIRFHNDYSQGAHPRILQKLLETNGEQNDGYGRDVWCDRARGTIRRLCEAPKANVQFLVGGTQANATILATLLRPYQGVICADTGHIAVHEAGAVEAGGHKVLALPGREGKLTAAAVDAALAAHHGDATAEHMVEPAAVYVSFPTELGTLYTAEELLALRAVCDRWNLVLFLDGARLGYGIAAPGNDVTLPLLVETCDVFTIGGTKQGLLFGEAVVFRDSAHATGFRQMMKRAGGMLAKGWLLGLQFEEILRDGLYFSLSAEADRLALKLKAALREMGIPLYVDSPTNQQFPVLERRVREALAEDFAFSVMAQLEEDLAAVRFCTSWATREADVDALIRRLGQLV